MKSLSKSETFLVYSSLSFAFMFTSFVGNETEKGQISETIMKFIYVCLSIIMLSLAITVANKNKLKKDTFYYVGFIFISIVIICLVLLTTYLVLELYI
jgi:hypothetical protein